jgi:hypothetical protein
MRPLARNGCSEVRDKRQDVLMLFLLRTQSVSLRVLRRYRTITLFAKASFRRTSRSRPGSRCTQENHDLDLLLNVDEGEAQPNTILCLFAFIAEVYPKAGQPRPGLRLQKIEEWRE